MRLILKLLGFTEKEEKPKEFHELSAEEKRALIKTAAREATQMQKDLVDRYNKKYLAI